MDPRYTFRKGYDTDLLILRSLFALDPNTNLPISSFYSPVADGIGGIQWLSLTQYFSAGTGILNFVSSVESFSTITGLFSNFSTQASSNLTTGNITASTLSTVFISTKNVTLSSLTFFDVQGNSSQRVTFSTGNMFVNGNLFYNPNTVLLSSLVSSVVGLGTAGYISSSQFLSTIDKLGDKGLLYVNRAQLVSTTIALSTNNYSFSTTAGIFTLLSNTSNYVDTVGTATSNYASDTVGLASSNYTNTVGTATSNYAVTVDRNTIVSTVAGLGTIGYISSSQLVSTVVGLGGVGLISTGQLVSTVIGLGGVGLISTGQLTSTVQGLGTAGYISSSQFLSALTGLATFGFLSTSQITSTVAGLGTAGYVSTSQLTSTVAGLSRAGYISTSQLVSTVEGLGAAGYISSSQLTSTVIGLGRVGYISSSQLLSSIDGLDRLVTEELISSVRGLGTAGYISSSQLVSTVQGLGGSGLIVTGQLVSTVDGITSNIFPPLFVSTVVNLGRVGYVSTSQLVSTTIGLQGLLQPASGIVVSSLVSTVVGLGTIGYVSTASLVSTTTALANSFFVVNANDVFIGGNGTRISISSAGSIVFFSTFMNSSITYQGNNGAITGSNTAATAPLYFSSATLNLDRWSNYINAQSIVTIEAYPNFLFANLGLTSNPTRIFMSTLIQSGRNFLSSQMFESAIYPTTFSNAQSNAFDPAIKMSIPGSALTGFISQPTRLIHYLPNAVTIGTTQGFSNSNVSIFFGSTNSLFLSIQNLPL